MDKYKKYAELKQQAKAIEDALRALQDDMISELSVNPEAGSEFGKFTIGKKPIYTYSAKIKSLEDDLKLKKEKEKENGTAIVNETLFIRYTNI